MVVYTFQQHLYVSTSDILRYLSFLYMYIMHGLTIDGAFKVSSADFEDLFDPKERQNKYHEIIHHPVYLYFGLLMSLTLTYGLRRKGKEYFSEFTSSFHFNYHFSVDLKVNILYVIPYIFSNATSFRSLANLYNTTHSNLMILVR